MKRAKALGIDAFALNIGVDPYTDTQLNFAYESAARNDMKVFISFDFNWYNTGQATTVGQKVAQYGNRPAQLKVDGKVFVSSFAGDGLDIQQMKAASGMDVYFAPNFHPGQGDFSKIDGALNWMAWDNNGDNKAPSAGRNVSVTEGDQSYTKALGGKGYIARKFGLTYYPLRKEEIRMTQKTDSINRSGIWLVLHALWRRGALQQKLGVPRRSALVQPLAGDPESWPSICRDHHLE